MAQRGRRWPGSVRPLMASLGLRHWLLLLIVAGTTFGLSVWSSSIGLIENPLAYLMAAGVVVLAAIAVTARVRSNSRRINAAGRPGISGASNSSPYRTGPSSAVFVGRSEEQMRFRQVLTQLTQDDAGPDEGYVLLVRGHGGMGKTALLRRYRDIALENPGVAHRQPPLVALVDWEDDRRLHPGDYG